MKLKLGVFARTFQRDTLDGVLDAVVARGFQTVQFSLRCAGMETLPSNLEAEHCRRIRTGFDERGLEMGAISGTFNAIHPNPSLRRDYTERCRRLIAIAPELGTHVVSLCSGSRDACDMWRVHPDNQQPAAWRDLVETLGALLPVAERAGVTLVIEPEGGNVVHSAVAARRLLDEMRSRNLGIALDAANLYQAGDRIWSLPVLEAAWALLGSDVVIVHLKGFGEATLCRAGWSEFVRILRNSRFFGPVFVQDIPEAELDTVTGFLRQEL